MTVWTYLIKKKLWWHTLIQFFFTQSCSSLPKSQPLTHGVTAPHSLTKLLNKAISPFQLLPDQVWLGNPFRGTPPSTACTFKATEEKPCPSRQLSGFISFRKQHISFVLISCSLRHGCLHFLRPWTPETRALKHFQLKRKQNKTHKTPTSQHIYNYIRNLALSQRHLYFRSKLILSHNRFLCTQAFPPAYRDLEPLQDKPQQWGFGPSQWQVLTTWTLMPTTSSDRHLPLSTWGDWDIGNSEHTFVSAVGTVCKQHKRCQMPGNSQLKINQGSPFFTLQSEAKKRQIEEIRNTQNYILSADVKL